MSETAKIGVGNEVYSLDVSPQFQTYSGVEIIVDEETSYLAGNDINRILRIENPWGTQAQAEAILEALQAKAFQYQPFTASGASLNPAAEIGDGVTVSDTYSGINKMTRTFSPLATAEIEAPQDEEIDHEFPFEPKEDRIYKREINDTRAALSITATQIMSEVEELREDTLGDGEQSLKSQLSQTANEINANVVKKTGGSSTSFGWSLTDSAWSVYSNGSEVFRIDGSGATVKGTITATSGTIGGFNIGQSSLWNGTNSLSETGNGVYVGTDGISVGGGAFKVTASGSVSAKNMTLTGNLTIGNDTISANQLRSGAYSAYTNGSTWSTGAGYGYNYNNATSRSSGVYPSYFRAASIYGGNISTPALYATSFELAGSSIIKYPITINGRQYTLLGVG